MFSLRGWNKKSRPKDWRRQTILNTSGTGESVVTARFDSWDAQRNVILFHSEEFFFFKFRAALELFYCHTLREKCPYLEFSAPYFPGFGPNLEIYGVSLCIQCECGKIPTRKTPMDTFHVVIFPAPWQVWEQQYGMSAPTPLLFSDLINI